MLYFRSSSDESRSAERPRHIYTQRTTPDVGIRLIGGNATGVFVASISDAGPFANTDLKIGDQILVLNGKDLRHATAEQVATELNRPSESLHITAQYDINSKLTCHGLYTNVLWSLDISHVILYQYRA